METEKDYIRTADGRFVGLRESSCGENPEDCAVFRGIVYARYERFCLPEMVSYEGDGQSAHDSSENFVHEPYDATRYGCLCPQDLSHIERQLGRNAGLKMEEGRLCLSVTVPCSALNGGEKLPVMAWIHGGSYLTGGSEDHRYDVCELSTRGRVVVVKISYRLGALGYLWFEGRGNGDLKASGKEGQSCNLVGKENLSCNLGLEDQKTALKWFRRHIASFGGDPENITLFGQSAGAHSIASLIASADSLAPGSDYPLFGGEILFHKAILQSAPLGITITPSEASRVTRRFFRELASMSGNVRSRVVAEDMFKACLDGSVTTSQILSAQDKVRGLRKGMTFMPVLQDNMRIPDAIPLQSESSLDAKSWAAGHSGEMQTAYGEPPENVTGKFSVLMGCNSEDASPYARKALGPLWRTPLRPLVTKLLTDRVFRKPMFEYARRLKVSGIPVGTYLFNWAPEDSALGCCHSIELPFLLGHYEDWLTAEMLQGMTREDYEKNSGLFQRLWSEFARNGQFPTKEL